MDMALALARAVSDEALAARVHREGPAYARLRGRERTSESLLAVCRAVALPALADVTGSLTST